MEAQPAEIGKLKSQIDSLRDQVFGFDFRCLYGILLKRRPCVSQGSASQRTTQITNKSRFGRVEGTSFQMWTNQALAGHAGTLQRSFCFVRFIKSFENVEASLLVFWPMVSFVQRRFRKKAAALSTSPSSGKSHETFFFTWPRLQKELKVTVVSSRFFLQTHPIYMVSLIL